MGPREKKNIKLADEIMDIAINDESRMYVIKNVTYAIYDSSATHSFLVVSIYRICY